MVFRNQAVNVGPLNANMHFVSLSLKKSIAEWFIRVRNRARELATRAKSAGRLATNATTANRDYCRY